jgi:NAD-dependent dihydropyrimidine dehydrogenase PreA subunit
MPSAPDAMPRSCKPAPTGQVPVVDRNRCEAKDDCVQVCPYGVFELRVLTVDERAGVSLRGRLNLLVHRNRQAVVVAPDVCHACGLCVAACTERAIRLTPRPAA